MALADTDTAPAATGPSGPSGPGGRPSRVVAMSVYATAFLAWWFLVGLPTDWMVALLWLWAGTVAWNPHLPLRAHLGFVRDWLPVLALLVLYDFSRGLADDLQAPHVTEMITADRALFGGELPTLWLQQHLYDPDAVRWWDVLGSWVYFSHFVVSLFVAVVLWLRSRRLWAAFMRRWFCLTALGLATYFAYPAAPPWWAARDGIIDPVVRVSARGWEAVGLQSAGKLLNYSQALSNPVAAMPSLHSAFALFVVAFFFTRVGRGWLPVLLAYPAAMLFTLVYSAEHYVVDVLVGWAYVGLTFLLVGLAERWWRRRRSQIGAAGQPVHDLEALTPERTPSG